LSSEFFIGLNDSGSLVAVLILFLRKIKKKVVLVDFYPYDNNYKRR